jgi:hypothetical protein
MKPLIYSACIILGLLGLGFTTAHAGTEVYMSMDAEGNVMFSDIPSDNSQRHEVRELPSLPAFNPEPPPTPEPAKRTEAAFSYTSLAIVSPRDNEALPTGAAGNIEVSGVLSPALRDSDSLVLLDNGTIIAKGRQTSFNLQNLDRGEHSLQLQVRNADDEPLISSNLVVIAVFRASVLSR